MCTVWVSSSISRCSLQNQTKKALCTPSKWSSRRPRSPQHRLWVFRSAFRLAMEWCWCLRPPPVCVCVCVFWSILFTVPYNWFSLGVLACFVLALLWYFLFFFWGLLIFYIKSVKTGSRLLSVTLPLHNSSSGSVTSTDVCDGIRREVKYMQSADLLPAAMLFMYQQEKSQTP